MAVRAVSKASKINLSISHIGNNHPWTYTRDVDLNSPFYVSQGPFLIVADSIAVHDNSTTMFPFGSKPVREKHPFAEIFVRSYTDPKLSLDGFSYTIEPEQIVDEKGNSLIPKSYFPFSPSYQPDSFRTSAAALDLSHHSGKRIAVFKGNLRFLQVKKSSTWEVPDILNAKGATKTVLCEGVPVRFMINDITQIQDGYKIRVTLSTDHFPTSNESNPYLGSQLQFAMSRISQSMRLIDSTGNAFHIGSTSSGGDNDNFTVNISFFKNPDGTIPGDPAKLIIEVPTELTEIKVPFEFTNLPLPKVK
jgi:hypothetical protein